MAKNIKKHIVDVLGDMIVVVDTREQKNQHILDYLNEQNIPYIEEKMDTGDYTCRFPNYPEYDDMILVERKASLDEVAGNFTKGRARFEREFERIGCNQTMHMVMENATWQKLLAGSYRSGFNPASYKASLVTFCLRYDVPVWFVERKNSPEVIHSILKYYIMEHIKWMNSDKPFGKDFVDSPK